MRFSARCASPRGDVATPRPRPDMSHLKFRTMTNIGDRFRAAGPRFRNLALRESLTASAGREKRAGRLESPGETSRRVATSLRQSLSLPRAASSSSASSSRVTRTTAAGLSFSISLSPSRLFKSFVVPRGLSRRQDCIVAPEQRYVDTSLSQNNSQHWQEEEYR